MKPITFTRRETLALAPEDIAGQILDLAKWLEFTGYGSIPGTVTRPDHEDPPSRSL